MRGNVPTRIEKAARGDCDAIVLARAGLARLALEAAPLVAFDLNPSLWVCAPGQGAMAVEARQDDHRVLPHLAGLDDPATRACVSLERELLVSFGGGCHAPFGAWAVRTDQLCRVTVGAPGKGGRFSVRTFEATDLDSIRSQARAWIADGCQAREPADDHGGEAWISRPALPWF
ncbi:MAG: hypothetical protein HY815_21865 [Candidatus Riflebacteria bacterium]|nr:hypothetical protein [Candidatus Riflebacteria bacterium]